MQVPPVELQLTPPLETTEPEPETETVNVNWVTVGVVVVVVGVVVVVVVDVDVVFFFHAEADATSEVSVSEEDESLPPPQPTNVAAQIKLNTGLKLVAFIKTLRGSLMEKLSAALRFLFATTRGVLVTNRKRVFRVRFIAGFFSRKLKTGFFGNSINIGHPSDAARFCHLNIFELSKYKN